MNFTTLTARGSAPNPAGAAPLRPPMKNKAALRTATVLLSGYRTSVRDGGSQRCTDHSRSRLPFSMAQPVGLSVTSLNDLTGWGLEGRDANLNEQKNNGKRGLA